MEESFLIKGNERRIIVIEKAEDPYFERVVFYIRRGVAEGKNRESLSSRAQRILEESCIERTSEPETGGREKTGRRTGFLYNIGRKQRENRGKKGEKT